MGIGNRVHASYLALGGNTFSNLFANHFINEPLFNIPNISYSIDLSGYVRIFLALKKYIIAKSIIGDIILRSRMS